MKFKAIIFDLDGTAILNSQYAKPSQKLIDTISIAKKSIKISAATGRTDSTSFYIFQDLKLEDPCITTAGGQIVDPKTKEILWKESMSAETVKKILDYVDKLGYEVDLGSQYDNFPEYLNRSKSINDEVVIYLDNVPIPKTLEIEKNIKKIADVNVHGALSYTPGCYDLSITSINASKKHAIQKLEGILNVKKEEIIGVGDSNNDLPLFEAVGFKVAMGNATNDLKKKADFLADNVENDGLAKVIEKFVLK